MKHSLTRAGATALLLASGAVILVQESEAKIVDEGKLAQYCREERSRGSRMRAS